MRGPRGPAHAARRRSTIKPLFIQGPSITTRLVLLVVLSVAMMFLDHRFQQLEKVRAALSVALYPLQYLVNVPAAVGDRVGESLMSREALLEENARLKRQATLLRAQLQKLNALASENQRLRELLQSSRKVGERMLIAELLAVDADPFTHQVGINKGSRHGVYRGQPLLDAQGVMGQVIHVGPFSATAMLITDANHALPVQVDRNGLRAIAVGTGDMDRLDIPFLPHSADIQVGDLLTTSGLGGRFPPGYPVAVVSEVVKDARRPYARVSARPTARLERSREVLLVTRAQGGAAR